MHLKHKPTAFLDTETTGLDPDEHEIIEITVLKGDSIWNTRIKPLNIDKAQPKALEINGYRDHPELWDNAPLFTDIVDQLVEQLTNVVIIGTNTQFDMNFILRSLNRCGVDHQIGSYHWIDITTLAYEHLVPLGLHSLALVNVCKFLGISNEGAHSATSDAQRVKLVFEKLSRAGVLNRLYWRIRNWFR